MRVAYGDREGAGGGVARPVRHLEGVCRCADWERRPGRQARRLGRALTGTVVRADRGAVAHDRIAKVRRIGYGDVRRAADRWQLRVVDCHCESTSGSVTCTVHYLERVRRCANREGSARRQTGCLEGGRTRTVIRADRGAVAHDRTAKVRRIGYGDVRRAADRWQLRVVDCHCESTSGSVTCTVHYLERVRRYANREEDGRRQTLGSKFGRMSGRW